MDIPRFGSPCIPVTPFIAGRGGGVPPGALSGTRLCFLFGLARVNPWETSGPVSPDLAQSLFVSQPCDVRELRVSPCFRSFRNIATKHILAPPVRCRFAEPGSQVPTTGTRPAGELAG